MSITILSSPPAVEFARSKCLYKLESDNYISSPGTQASFYITFQEWPAADETITIAYTKVDALSLVFTFKASPDDSGYQLLRSTIYTLENYVSLLLAAFKANYYLFRDWTITQGTGANTDKIYFTARENGLYDPTITDTSTKVSSTVTEQGSADTLRDDFRVFVETYKNDGVPSLLGEDFLSVDSNGQVEIDLRDYLLPELEWPLFTYPQDGNNALKLTTGFIDEFFIRTGEYYSGYVRKLTDQSVFRAMHGGVGGQRQAVFNAVSDSLFGMISGRGQFLTWLPVHQVIDRNTPVYLYFLNAHPMSTLKLKAKVFYTNGNSQTYNIKTLAGCAQYRVYEVVASCDKLFQNITLPTYPGAYIYKYEVWIEDPYGFQLSETRTYELDYKPWQNVRYFVFLNSFGVYDSVRVIGSFSKQKEYDFVKVAFTPESDFGQRDFFTKNVFVEKTESFKANSGYTNLASDYAKHMAEAFEELFLSLNPFEITNEGPVPIVIEKANHVVSSDESRLYAIEFEYRKTYTDRLWSNIIDGGTAVGEGGYLGEGFGAGILQDPGIIITVPLGT